MPKTGRLIMIDEIFDSVKHSKGEIETMRVRVKAGLKQRFVSHFSGKGDMYARAIDLFDSRIDTLPEAYIVKLNSSLDMLFRLKTTDMKQFEHMLSRVLDDLYKLYFLDGWFRRKCV